MVGLINHTSNSIFGKNRIRRVFPTPVTIDKCSYLDPRFRTHYLNNKEETLIQIKSETLTTSDDIYKEKPPEEDEPPPSKKLKELGAILTKIVGTDSGSGSEASPAGSSERIDREMKLHLERPATDPDSDPLIWWLGEKKEITSDC